MTVETAAQAAYIVAALLFILALAGLSHHETAKAGNTFGIAGMAVALVATIALAIDRDISGAGLALLVGGDGGRRRDRAVAGPGGRDDRDARADRAAALASSVWPRCWSAGTATCTSRPTPTAPRPSCSQVAGPARDPLRRGVHRGLHRRGHLHRLDRGVPQAVGADQVQPADAAGQERAQPRRPGRVRRADRLVRDRPAAVAAGRGHRDRAGAGLAPGRLHRRRRHARRGLDAEQLLRLGRGRVGVPARERPADHHRRPGRLLGCLPVLHHVQGDEPLVHLRDRRRLRHRGRPGRRHRLRRAPRDHRRGRRRAARRRRLRDHHPRLRHGRRPGPVRRRRADPQAPRARRQRPVRHPPGRRPPARAT